ncbi:MAG: HEAT repeat domain-containing protein [Nitrospirae bacterium]|nr:HEAT repeat domain-containing protein [Nitrospirota bacterium]
MQEMRKFLSDEDVELRRKGVLALRRRSSDDAIPLLLKAMEDTSWRVRKTAAEILLEEHPPERSVNGLIQLLSIEDNAGARNSAIETLVKLGKKATSFLLEAFETGNRDVRKFIIDIIGEVKDRKALPLLLKALKDDDDNVRASAVEHLGQMGDPAVVDALTEILKSGDLWTAFPAADALGRIGDKKAIPSLISALAVKALREPVLKGLGHLSAPETLEHIVPFLMDTSKTIQEEAIKTIGVFYHNGVSASFICETMSRLSGPDLINRLVSHAWSKKADIRVKAILLLGLMQDERALGPLLELYTEESLVEDVKRALVFIGRSKPGSLLPLFETDNQYQKRFITEVAVEVASPLYSAVFENFLSDGDGHVRASAAIGLSMLGNMTAIQVVKKLLSDPYEDVQEAAVTALSNLREGIDVDEFISYLKHKSPAMRRNAAMLLGAVGAENSVSALGYALKDEDVSVRQAVIEALSSMKTDESVKYLILGLTDENPHIRASAALSLGSVGGEKALDPLFLLLSDSDDTVKVSAIRSLGMRGERKAVKALIAMLADRNGFVVTTALESLGTLGGDEARDALMKMLASEDREIRRTAIRSLSSFEGLEEVTLPYLQDPDWATRVAAIEALGKRPTERVRTEVEKLFDREEDPVVRRAIKEAFDVR